MAGSVPVLNSSGLRDQTGRSRGFTDNALGTLFGNLAQNFDAVVPALERDVNRNIREEIREGTDAIFRNFVGIDQDIERDGNRPPSRALPEDASRDLESLTRLRKRWQAGKINADHLNTAAAALAKKVKSRYPGFKDEVNAALSRNGFNPAQDTLRAHQAAQRSAQSSTDSSLKDNLRTIDWMMKNGHMGGNEMREVLANPVAAAQNPTIMGQLRIRAAQEAAKETAIEQKTKILNVQSKQNALNVEEAKSTMAQQLNNVYTKTVRQSEVWQEFEQAQQEAVASTRNGQPASGQQIAKLRSAWTSVKSFWTQQKEELFAKNQYANISPEVRTELEKFHNTIVSSVEEGLVTGGTTGTSILKDAASFMDTMSNQSQIDLAREVPEFMSHVAIKRAIGEQGLQRIIVNSPKGITPYQNFISNKVTAQIARNDAETLVEALKASRLSGNEDGKIFDQVIANTLGIFRQSESDPAIVTRFFNATFSRDNRPLMKSLSPQRRKQLYQEMTSGEVRRSVDEYVSKGVLSAEQFRAYTTYIVEGFMDSSREEINTANTLSQRSEQRAVQFDEAQQRYVVVNKPFVQRQTIGSARNAVSNIAQNIFLEPSEREFNDIATKLNNSLAPIPELLTKAKQPAGPVVNSIVGVPLKEGTRVRSDTQTVQGTRRVTPLDADTDAVSTLINESEPFANLSADQQSVLKTLRAGKAPENLQRKLIINPQELSEEEVNTLAEAYSRVSPTTIQGIETELRELASIVQNPEASSQERAIAMEDLTTLFNEAKNNVKSDEESMKDNLDRAKQVIKNIQAGVAFQ